MPGETTKTKALRTLIETQLNTLSGDTYHRRAKTGAVYPYKVYAIDSVNIGDPYLDIDMLTVDIWDKSDSPLRAEMLADKVEALFNSKNLPQATILPTFFREDRRFVEDNDINIQHVIVQFSIQLYERTDING